MDTEYLKAQLGGFLQTCLAEVSAKRPHDPIEFIAHWLYKHIENVNFEKQKVLDAEELTRQEKEHELEQLRFAKMQEEKEIFEAEEAERNRLEEEARKEEEAAAGLALAPVKEGDEGAAQPVAQDDEQTEQDDTAEQQASTEQVEAPTEQPDAPTEQAEETAEAEGEKPPEEAE